MLFCLLDSILQVWFTNCIKLEEIDELERKRGGGGVREKEEKCLFLQVRERSNLAQMNISSPTYLYTPHVQLLKCPLSQTCLTWLWYINPITLIMHKTILCRTWIPWIMFSNTLPTDAFPKWRAGYYILCEIYDLVWIVWYLVWW